MNWERLLQPEKLDDTKGIAHDPKFDEYEVLLDFEKDYHKILTSAPFRRLQDKTQVFPLDESDFVRTRLTHSLEVSSFGKKLARMACTSLEADEKYAIPKKYYSSVENILASAGLLHDIGNPPFGHSGEQSIREWFIENLSEIDYNGVPLDKFLDEQMALDLKTFEGNSQALRLLTKLHSSGQKYGMNLNVSILNTLIKYPCSSKEWFDNKNSENQADDIKYKKLGYFYADMETYDAITSKTECINCRHPLTYLLEAADDISYATADIEDAFKKDLFTYDELLDTLNKSFEYYNEKYDIPNFHGKNYTKGLIDKLKEIYEYGQENATELGIGDVSMYAVQKWIEYAQNWFSYCVIFSFSTNIKKIIDGNYTKELIDNTFHQYSMNILKDVAVKLVYPNDSINKLELSAHNIISFLLDRFANALIYYDTEYSDEKVSKIDNKLINLISKSYMKCYKDNAKDKRENEKLYLRLLLATDFICGMTDTYAKSLYQQLNGIY